MVSSNDISMLVQGLEGELPVDEWMIDGVHVWPLFRAAVSMDNFFMYARRSPNASASPRELPFPIRPALEIIASAGRCVRAQSADPAHNDRLHQVDALLYSDGASFVHLAEGYYDRFCDPLRVDLAALGLTSLMVTPLTRFQTPRASPSVFVQPWLDLARVHARAAHALRRHDVRLEGFTRAAALLRDAVPDIVLRDAEHFARVATSLLAFQGVYRRILDATRPRVVFVVCYYGTEPMALIRECRARGIKTVDLQHGCINEGHRAYAGWRRVPTGGYPLLPDAFFVWSEQEARTIRAWSDATNGAHRAIVAGNAFLEMWRTQDLEDARIARARVAAVRQKAGSRRHVLYTANGYESEAELVKLCAAVDASADRLFWWVRSHPAVPAGRGVLAQALSGCRAKNFVMERADVPLYGLLREMDAHVTEASSTVIEAKELGVPSVLLSSAEAVLYRDLVESGWVYVLAPEEDLVAAVEQQITRAPRLVESEAHARRPSARAALRELLL